MIMKNKRRISSIYERKKDKDIFGINFSINQRMFEDISWFWRIKEEFLQYMKKKYTNILWHKFFNEQLLEKIYFDFKK